MTWLLDLLAICAVGGAVAYLLRGKRGGCCEPTGRRTKGAETRISVNRLRSTARR